MLSVIHEETGGKTVPGPAGLGEGGRSGWRGGGGECLRPFKEELDDTLEAKLRGAENSFDCLTEFVSEAPLSLRVVELSEVFRNSLA